jgi:hypothetical protein
MFDEEVSQVVRERVVELSKIGSVLLFSCRLSPVRHLCVGYGVPTSLSPCFSVPNVIWRPITASQSIEWKPVHWTSEQSTP